MKVSVSLPDEDVQFLDAYADERGIASRSAVLHKAVGLLRAVELSDDYEQAWQEWASSQESDVWDAAVADGIVS